MAAFQVRHLVIDASIARAAGEAWQVPVSRWCREFLNEVQGSGHKVFATKPIKEEWDRHQSRFSRRWRTVMLSRKRWVRGEADHGAIARQLPGVVETPRPLAAMVKDCRLIEAALASDKRVASLDEEVRSLFGSVCPKLKAIGDVCWVNPTVVDEATTDWLRAGAPAERGRKLRHFTPRAGV